VQGPEHAWEPVILPRKLKFERAGLTFAEMQFIESEKMTTEQMLRVFRIHPILASQAVSAGLNSDVASTAMLMFLRFGVMPEARSIAGTLTERLLSTGEFGRNISCEFDFANDPVLVEAWLKQADAWSKATGAPVATRSEARDKLGLPDRDDEFPTLDEPLVPVGMITEGESASPGADPVASSTSKPPASSEAPASNQVASEDNPADINESRSLARMDRDAMRTRSDRRLGIHERKVKAEVNRLFRRQRDRVIATLASQSDGRAADARFYQLDALVAQVEDPEDKRRVRRLLRAIIADVGDAAIAELAQELAFSLAGREVAAFIEENAALFIKNINATTVAALRETLAAGVESGEGMGALVARVPQTR
jgi:hypothetical protein